MTIDETTQASDTRVRELKTALLELHARQRAVAEATRDKTVTKADRIALRRLERRVEVFLAEMNAFEPNDSRVDDLLAMTPAQWEALGTK